MWVWRKKEVQERPWQGAARASLAGAAREEPMREGIHSISRDGRSDRIGVWLEQDSLFDPLTPAPARFRGIIWEAGGDDAPEEWQKPSLESTLPQELLASGKSFYQEVDVLPSRHPNHTPHAVPNSSPNQMHNQASRLGADFTSRSAPGLASGLAPGSVPSSASSSAMIGPLVGLRHALWTPIEAKGRLRGLILTGSRKKLATLPTELAESVAAELALALEFEQDRRLARERQADVGLAKSILSSLGGNVSPDTVLSQLATSCTEVRADASGAGASFAVIGQRRAPEPNAASNGGPHPCTRPPNFRNGLRLGKRRLLLDQRGRERTALQLVARRRRSRSGRRRRASRRMAQGRDRTPRRHPASLRGRDSRRTRGRDLAKRLLASHS